MSSRLPDHTGSWEPTAANLVNCEFEEHGPRSILLTDITYIPLNGSYCYLSTILDACTKQVLSYVLSESLEVDFVLETVKQLVEKHSVSLNNEIKKWTTFEDVKRSVDDWIDYYNNDRYQWDLAKLSPNEYYDYIITGKHPVLF